MGAESLLFCYVVWEWIAGVTMGGGYFPLLELGIPRSWMLY